MRKGGAMGKGLRLAIVVEAVVLVAAFAFSAVYFSRNLYHTSHAPTVVLVVLWFVKPSFRERIKRNVIV